MIEAFPLYWPVNRPRIKKEDRKSANFHAFKDERSSYSGNTYRVKKRLSVAEATKRLVSELDKYTKVGHPYRVEPGSIIISSNIPIKKDGLPYSNYSNPEDPGVAVYFTLDGKPYCLPCDKWDRVEDNIAAIAAHVAAMRGIERWGVGEAHDVYTGFKALPEATEAYMDIWLTLGLSGKPDDVQWVKNAFRHKAGQLHPDKPGGSHEAFTHLQEAYQKALTFFQ